MSTWTTVPFDDAFDEVSAGSIRTPQSEFLPSGRFPIIDQGKQFIAGYTDSPDAVCHSEQPVIVFGDHTRCFKFVDFRFCIGADGVKVLKPRPQLAPKYAFYLLMSLSIPAVGYGRHFKYLRRLSVRFPNLDEQLRIVKTLDRAEALRAKRRSSIALLDSLLHSAFREKFGDLMSNSKGLPIRRVSDFVSAFHGGRSVEAASSENTRFRVLKVSAVTSMVFDPLESKPLPDNHTPRPEHFVRPGDLLFSRANTSDLVGAVALVPDAVASNLVLPDKLWRFVWKDSKSVEPRFVWQLFQEPSVRRQIAARATGTSGSMKNISQEKLMDVAVGFPDVNEQRAFARRAFAIDALRARLVRSEQSMNELFASLQHRAFNGTL